MLCSIYFASILSATIWVFLSLIEGDAALLIGDETATRFEGSSDSLFHKRKPAIIQKSIFESLWHISENSFPLAKWD